MSDMRATIDSVRAVQEYKSYVPPEPGDAEQIAEAKADELSKFNELNNALDAELGNDNSDDDSLGPVSSPEKIFAEGKMAARAAAERAAAKVREDAGKPRDEKGKFQKQALNTLSSSLGLEDDGDDGESAAATTNKPADALAGEDAELRRAELKLALVRSHYTEKQISEMERDGTFEKVGTKRAMALKADDEAHSFLREHRKPAADDGKTENREPARKAEQSEPLDLDPLIKPLAAKLGLEEDGASTLKESFEKLAEVVTKRAEKQIQRGLEGVSDAQAAQRGQQVFADAQVEIGVRCPDLLDPKKFDEALEVVSELAKTQVVQRQLQRFATPKEKALHLLSAAANALEYEVKPSGSVIQARGEKELRAHARSTISDRARPAPSTQREKDWAAYNDSMAKHGY